MTYSLPFTYGSFPRQNKQPLKNICYAELEYVNCASYFVYKHDEYSTRHPFKR